MEQDRAQSKEVYLQCWWHPLPLHRPIVLTHREQRVLQGICTFMDAIKPRAHVHWNDVQPKDGSMEACLCNRTPRSGGGTRCLRMRVEDKSDFIAIVVRLNGALVHQQHGGVTLSPGAHQCQHFIEGAERSWRI